jgi:sialidase-1
VLESGRVVMMFQRFPAGYHARAMGDRVKQLEPGLEGDTVSTTLVCFSDDDGKTWSVPRDVTAGTKRGAPIISTASGPGMGIVLKGGEHAGRIVMPTNEGWYEGGDRHFAVYACYSDDDGETWRAGQPAPNGEERGQGNEVQMVELANGSVMLNTRSNGGTGHRKVAISEDGGETWSPLRDELAHPESQCMGTIVRQAWPEGGTDGVLVFANPANRKGRSQGTIRLSFDEGKTWPVSRLVHEGGYAYSCLAPMADGAVGLLYEADGYERIDFVRVTLDWVRADE